MLASYEGFADRLKQARRSKYSIPDMEEFATMLRNGAENQIPMDIGPMLVQYGPLNDDILSLWLYACLEREGLSCHFVRQANTDQIDLKDTCSHLDFIGDMFFDRKHDVILLGNRGSGKTVTFATLLLLEALYKPGIELAHLGAIKTQAERCYDYFSKMVRHSLFRDLLEKEPLATRTYFRNKSKVEILIGSMTGVNCLFGDTQIRCVVDDNQGLVDIPIRDLVGKTISVPTTNEKTGKMDYFKAVGTYSGKAPCVEVTLEYVHVAANTPIAHLQFCTDKGLRSFINTASPRPCISTYKPASECKIICTTDHHIFMGDTLRYCKASNLKKGRVVASIQEDGVWVVVSVEPYLYSVEQDVYDLTVQTELLTNHNFVTSDGIVLHNSPHPTRAHIDEVELIEWKIMQEAFNMARSRDPYRASTRLTSTRKMSTGTMQKLITEADQRGFTIYKWNIWDTIEVCRLKTDKRGRVDDPMVPFEYSDIVTGKAVPIMVYESCLNCVMVSTCKGQAKFSNAGKGVISINDTIGNYNTLDTETWIAQVVCQQPGRSDLVYHMFEPQVHVIDYDAILREKYGNTYEYHHDVAIPVICGQDAGFGCPGTVYCQVIDDPDGGDPMLIVIDEWYIHDVAPSVYISDYLQPKHEEYNVDFYSCDPAGQALIAELELVGYSCIDAENDVDYGLDIVKSLFATKHLFIDKRCVNLVTEIQNYVKMPSGKPKKVNDHLCDALRYIAVESGVYESVMSDVYY